MIFKTSGWSGEEKMLEPQENGLTDLPDYEHIEDETFPPFPPPASPGREDGEGAEPEEESGRGAPVPVPPKRTVKRNIPKLNAERLISERGLPALRHVFEKAKFKGKGHEAEDLKTLIRHMEHWAHRLFPKLQFEDFIDRVECLGNKKEVQTCLKRIRLDLPILHEDFVSNNDEVEENNGHDVTATELDHFLTNSYGSVEFASESSRSLTEEEQQRIERNKQLALERRQAKLLSNSQSLGNDLSVNTPSTQTSEAGSTGEEQKEEESNGFNKDLLDSPHNAGAASTVNEEEQLKVEETQLDQSF
ncbi:TIMELESS-interacting protein isoform X3 [Bos javanicus]|uniref:TIMELESS-interacting protein n=2 Tax=Bos TaxID=9903 RepID=A0A452DHP4_BOVIN|nr:TIMELESS-interacting protein isoform 1 [Bos taurus]XP_059746248.1 TIMELESS-interacting protein isoform X2 [Bos taurus]XP_061286120.1 TIMELESS-interacting protein isoform X3 [Bos javanicus]XP_061286121.1 TIMELESS-interacting protein isoform X3 [Bos javanicus]